MIVCHTFSSILEYLVQLASAGSTDSALAPFLSVCIWFYSPLNTKDVSSLLETIEFQSFNKSCRLIPCGQIFSVLYAPAPGVISVLRSFALNFLFLKNVIWPVTVVLYHLHSYLRSCIRDFPMCSK